MSGYLVQEDGTSRITLENGLGSILLETTTAGDTLATAFVTATIHIQATITRQHTGTTTTQAT